MPLTVSPVAAAAARAAVSAAAGLGVPCDEPSVLADGANVVVHLRPSPVVAKVAATTAAVRADPAAWLQRELDLAVFLTAAGAPVMVPSPEVPATSPPRGRARDVVLDLPEAGRHRPGR